MNIGNALKEIRQRLKLTQIEVGKRLNISSTSLSQIELGNKQPSKKTMDKFSKEFEIPVGLIYIMGLESKDVPVKKQALYDAIFPSIKEMIFSLSAK